MCAFPSRTASKLSNAGTHSPAAYRLTASGSSDAAVIWSARRCAPVPQPGEALRPRRDEVPFTQSPADAGALAWVLGCAGARGLLSVPVVVFAAGGQRDRGANIGDTRKKCSAIQRKSSLSLAAGFYRQDAPLPAGCKTTMQALGPERPVELFDERVVGGLPRSGRVQRNNVELGPQTERLLIYTRLSRRTRHLVRAVFPESRQHAG